MERERGGGGGVEIGKGLRAGTQSATVLYCMSVHCHKVIGADDKLIIIILNLLWPTDSSYYCQYYTDAEIPLCHFIFA